jgi:hypothetical protein
VDSIGERSDGRSTDDADERSDERADDDAAGDRGGGASTQLVITSLFVDAPANCHTLGTSSGASAPYLLYHERTSPCAHTSLEHAS